MSLQPYIPPQRRILVVEDDEGLNRLAQKTLRRAGFEVQGVLTGGEALELVQADPTLVLLLDQELPDMSGTELVGLLAAQGRRVAFVAMTGHGDESVAVRMMKLGARDYLTKGVNLTASLPETFQRVFRELETELRLAEAEQSLRRELALNQALADIAKALTQPGARVPAIAAVVQNHALRITRSPHGYVSSIDPETGDNVGHTLSAMMDRSLCQVQDKRVAFPKGEQGYGGLYGHALNTLEPFFTNNPAQHPAAAGLPEGHVPLERFLSMPAVYEGELFGQIALANSQRDYTEQDLEAVAALAHLFAMAVFRMRSEENLYKARDAAAAASKAKSEFLANMSHEIRTPLNGILGILQLLETTDLDEEQREYVKSGMQSSKRLTSLLSDILDLSRVEAGKLGLQAEPFDLPETVRQIQDLFQPIAQQAGLAFHCHIAQAVPRLVVGDAVRISQVLSNLVGNAFKFTTRGSVSLEVSVLPDCLPGRCRVLFVVADTGVGIPEDKIGSLFAPFTQVSQGVSRKHQGAGLGLSICKRLVELMGGTIALDSESGVGTTIYCSIPLELTTTTRSQPKGVTAGQHRPPCPLRVLLAEDDLVSGLVGARLLAKLGATVRVVDNGQEALAALREQQFDLVLMDVQMPVLDGIEATRAIRRGDAGADRASIPIIAMTAYAMAGDQERILASGMDGYVAKPVSMDELTRVMGEVLGNGS